MRDVTVVIIWCSLVALIAWDVIAIQHGGTEASISHIIYEQCKRHPVIAFGLGFLCGHLVWK